MYEVHMLWTFEWVKKRASARNTNNTSTVTSAKIETHSRLWARTEHALYAIYVCPMEYMAALRSSVSSLSDYNISEIKIFSAP